MEGDEIGDRIGIFDIFPFAAGLLAYLAGYKALLTLVVLLLILSSACTVGGSYLIRPLINDYILPGDFPGLAKMLVVMGLVYAAGATCSFGYARIMVHVSQNTVAGSGRNSLTTCSGSPSATSTPTPTGN